MARKGLRRWPSTGFAKRTTRGRGRYGVVQIRSVTLISVLVLGISTCGGEAEPDGPPTLDHPASTATTVVATMAPSATIEPSTTIGNAGRVVMVYWSLSDGEDCAAVSAHERQIAATEDPITGAFRSLAAGPTPDETVAGGTSFFSAATADVINGVSLSEGLLVVDFTDVRLALGNASTSCGSAAFLASLDTTAFQFDDVERVGYTILGSCDMFYNWLQTECPDYMEGNE